LLVRQLVHCAFTFTFLQELLLFKLVLLVLLLLILLLRVLLLSCGFLRKRVLDPLSAVFVGFFWLFSWYALCYWFLCGDDNLMAVLRLNGSVTLVLPTRTSGTLIPFCCAASSSRLFSERLFSERLFFLCLFFTSENRGSAKGFDEFGNVLYHLCHGVHTSAGSRRSERQTLPVTTAIAWMRAIVSLHAPATMFPFEKLITVLGTEGGPGYFLCFSSSVLNQDGYGHI